jgi:hypothetical protein
MYFKPTVWKILSGLLLVALLAGCAAAPTAAPTALPTSTTMPTIDIQPTFAAVSTQAVATAFANLTQNAPTATFTPAATQTPAVTSTFTPTPTRVFIPWTQTPTPTQAAFTCTVTGVSPNSGATLKVDQDFDGKWTVKNSGTKTWTAAVADFRYISGDKFQQSADIVDLGSNVAPNGSFTVTVDMKAPSSDGDYATTWGLFLDDGSVCELSMNIHVTK